MRRLAALGVLLLVVALLVVAQFVLPGIAAQRLRDRLASGGQVRSVSVSAFPAIELLWHHADRVTVQLGRYRSSEAGLTKLLDESGDVGTLHARAGELDTGLLTVRDATLNKSGSALSATGQITESDLRRALPIINSVTPVASSGGRITLQGTATALGISATVTATVAPQDGELLVTPNVPFGGLATVRVFSDPRIAVTGVSARRTADGFTASATGRMR